MIFPAILGGVGKDRDLGLPSESDLMDAGSHQHLRFATILHNLYFSYSPSCDLIFCINPCTWYGLFSSEVIISCELDVALLEHVTLATVLLHFHHIQCM